MSEKIKIAMIDDEEDLCLVVKANLEDSGEFEVITHSDPGNAEDFVEQQKPDVILLDVVMPGRKGVEIVGELRKRGATKHIPIILVSGKGEMVYNKKKDEFKWLPNSKLVQSRGDLPDAKGAEALASAYGVSDYVSKPFTTDLLIDVIKDVLARAKKKTDSESEGPPPLGAV